MRIPDVTLLQNISAQADLVNMYADNAARAVENAAHYNVPLDCNPCKDDPTPYYESHIRRADNAYCDAKAFIVVMDKEIAALLRLRGELAEMTGIPMFSHIGEDQRFPNRHTYEV